MPNDPNPGTNLTAPEQKTRLITVDEIPVLDTAKFDQMHRVAKVMAFSRLVPQHLTCDKNGEWLDEREAVANCFLVVNQAVRWGMDPFAVAQGTFVHTGRIGYEGKLIAAVVNTHPRMAHNLEFRYDGEPGDQRRVTVVGYIKGEPNPRTIEGTVSRWRTKNSKWDANDNQDQMLAYRGAREWARRHLPEAIYGVQSDDEVQDIVREDNLAGGTTINGSATTITMPQAIAQQAGGEPVPQQSVRPTETVSRETGEITDVEQVRQQEQPTRPASGGIKANANMIALLTKKIGAARAALGQKATITEDSLKKDYEVAALEDLTLDQLNDALARIPRQGE